MNEWKEIKKNDLDLFYFVQKTLDVGRRIFDTQTETIDIFIIVE